MIVIGVTGNLASGKSEVARILRRKGAKVFDADLAAKQVVGTGMPVYKAIVKIFGKTYLNQDKTLDRKKLAERVFSHPADLKKLNTLTHPGVIFECFSMIERTRNKPGILVLDVPLLYESKMENLADFAVVIDSSLKNILKRTKNKKGILVLDVPLLYESKMESLADFTVVIDASQKNILKRTRRNGLSADPTRKILSTQWPLPKKAKRADFVIENNGTLKQLEKKVWEVVEQIKLKK